MRDPDGYCLFKIGHSYDLPGMAKDMKLLNNESKAITGSSFGTIQMWDYGTGDVKSVQTINYAHPSSVNGISISPTSNQEFVSCSSDKSVLVWDLRAGKPGARAVYEFHEAIFNSVHWGTDLENGSMIQAGDMGGRIYSFDLKMPGKIVSVLKVTEGKNQRPIRKFVYRGSDMAVVDHSCVARVYSKTREKPMEFSGNGPLIYDFLWDKLDENLCYVVGEKRYSKKLKIVEDQIVEC
jgi:WD40 repeat protein